MLDEGSDYAVKVQNLLAQLQEGSEFLENQKETLSRIWNDFHGTVCTFYETEPTKSIKQVSVSEFKSLPPKPSKCRMRLSKTPSSPRRSHRLGRSIRPFRQIYCVEMVEEIHFLVSMIIINVNRLDPECLRGRAKRTKWWNDCPLNFIFQMNVAFEVILITQIWLNLIRRRAEVFRLLSRT